MNGKLPRNPSVMPPVLERSGRRMVITRSSMTRENAYPMPSATRAAGGTGNDVA